MKRRLEFRGGSSSKFWEARVEGASLTVTFGRITTAGQSKTKVFDSARDAQQEADKLVREKLGKGYVEAAEIADPRPEATGKRTRAKRETARSNASASDNAKTTGARATRWAKLRSVNPRLLILLMGDLVDDQTGTRLLKEFSARPGQKQLDCDTYDTALAKWLLAADLPDDVFDRVTDVRLQGATWAQMCIGGDRDGSEYEVDSLVGIEQLPNIASIGFESMAHRVSLAPLTGLPHMQTVDPLSFLAGFTDYDALLSVPRLQRVAVCNFYPTGRSRKEYDVAVRVLSALARKGVIVDLGVQEVCGLIEMRNLELGLYGLRRLPNDAVKRNKEASSAIGYWLLKHRRWSEALEWFERLAARRSLAKGAHCNALCVFLAKHEDDGLPIDAGAARRLLDVCVREGKTDPSIFHNAAGVHLLLGEVDRALSYVKEAKSHGYDMRAVRTDSVFRPLADDPRFVALVGGCCS